MHNSCLALLLIVAVGQGKGLPHSRPSFLHQWAISSQLGDVLGIQESKDRFEHRPSRTAHPQQVAMKFEPLRFQTLYMWLDDPTKTCLPRSPANKLADVKAQAAASSAVDNATEVPGSNPKDPLQFYAPQPPNTIRVFNRELVKYPVAGVNITHNVECSPDRTLDAARRAFVTKRLVPRVVKFLGMMLGPRMKGSGGDAPLSGNDATSSSACLGNKCLRCYNDHFVFQLPYPYTFPNADVLLLVTAQPDFAPSYAFPCMFGSDARPTAIVLNIAPNQLAHVGQIPRGREKLQSRVLQSMLHALGFDVHLFKSWRMGAGPNFTVPAPYNPPTSNNAGSTVNVINTPAVRNWVERVHFRCNGHPKGGEGTVSGAELEDALADSRVTMPFWESRLYKGEILTMLPDLATDRGLDIPVVSGLTLAAFEDMGWYLVNKQVEQPLKWLREQPCRVANQQCDQWPARYVCNSSQVEVMCSPDFLSLAVCNAFDWPAGMIPDKFRRDPARASWGGADPLLDFCAVPDGRRMKGASCLIPVADELSCQTTKCTNFQVRGVTSRCFMSNVRYKEFGGGESVPMSGTCLPHYCTPVGTPTPGQPQQWRVTLQIAGMEYVCDGSQTEVGPSLFDTKGVANCNGEVVVGKVRCPDPRELCEEAGESAVAKACNPVEDCNSRGVCSATGECICFTELGSDNLPVYGMYAGARCERCLEGYHGANCRLKNCPVDPETRVPCFGNGECDGTTGRCVCYQNITHGYWSNTTNCRTCLTGKTGGTCKLTACDPSVSVAGGCAKGMCDPATLRCKCFESAGQGYWTTSSDGVCNRCMDGYDINQLCKVRIANYYGCSASPTPDILSLQECTVQCTAGEAVPRRITGKDGRGCVFHRPPATCRRLICEHPVDPFTNSTAARPGAPSGCPPPDFIPYDCQGFPNPYHDCWVENECKCEAPKRVQCILGTEAKPSPDAYPHISRFRTPEGGRDLRPVSTPSSTKECRCPKPAFVGQIDCWGSLVERRSDYPGGRQPQKPYEKGRIVFFEPVQMFEEDFCHCTSPPIPSCTDDTKPQWLLQREQGRRVDCDALIKDFGCPNWDMILNIGGVVNATGTDLSLIDCDGWPPPKLVADRDPCGCPFPQFKCIPGTMGKCPDPPNCPKWDPLPPINCLGQMPPVLTFHAPHPCGCPPPPKPTCIPGTERQKCNCKPAGVSSVDGSTCNIDDVEWVDCLGEPLEIEAWNPWNMPPNGDPWISPCDPCPQCAHFPPTRRCLPGTNTPSPPSSNVVPRVCLTGVFDKTKCTHLPTPCPVDCQGRPRAQEMDYDENCECPPVPVPPCIPGTEGTAPDSDIRPTPCEGSPQMCGAYACGGGEVDVEKIAADLGLRGDYSGRARDRVLETIGGSRVCVQEGQCSSHYHCAPNFFCGVCGLCLYGAPQPGGGCLADRGESCGKYACEVQCDAEGIALIKAGVRDATCKDRCYSNEDCKRGKICSVGVYSPPPLAGAAFAGKVKIVGKVREAKTADMPSGIPGFNPQATPPAHGLADEPKDFVPLRDYGTCVDPAEPDITAVQYCTSHDSCGGYACGNTNRQYMFSNSRCRSTCWVNAHCHPSYKCQRSTGRCVAADAPSLTPSGDTLPDGPTCDLQPFDFCSPYVCGGHRALHPLPRSVCPTSCTDDYGCQPFHTCVFPTSEETNAKSATDTSSQCDDVTGKRLSSSGQVYNRFLMDISSEAKLGTCVPDTSLKRRVQSDEDRKKQEAANPFVTDPVVYRLPPQATDIPMLSIPVGGSGGYQEDPMVLRFQHAPFRPPRPPAPPPLGTAVEESVIECYPYTAVAKGITPSQMRTIAQYAKLGVKDPNAGTFMSMPSCKTFCADDSDCAGGFFCSTPAKVRIFTSAGGKRVVAQGSGGKDGKWELGQQGLDEDFRAPENQPRAPGAAEPTKAVCQAKRGLGAVCAEGRQCGSGHCWNGICCNTACEHPCQTCVVLGVCGWVAPHTAPGRRCPKCHWCEYVSNLTSSTPITPSSPMECVPVPEGHDPNKDCGDHAVCNGEGACLADEGWGGTGTTCAAGVFGPNCESEVLNYRTVVTQEQYKWCTPDQAATLAASPAPQDTGVQQLKKRTGSGFEIVQPPANYLRRQQVVDRRPRQWATRVLGISSHSKYGCSNILYEPSLPRRKRTHGLSDQAWAPRQYVKMPAGVPDENPQLRYFPFVNCAPLTSGACQRKTGCKWVSSPLPGYCTGDGTVTTPGTGVSLQADGITYDPSSLPTPQPEEYIELEFDNPVYIETVVIHENFNPGSVIRIESQPALEGSSALASAGGGVLATDPTTGNEIPSSVVLPPTGGNTHSPVTTCGSLTALGMETCINDTACYWKAGECRSAQGTCSHVGEDSCLAREREGLCYWDTASGECFSGRVPGCYKRLNYNTRQYEPSCTKYNDLVAFPPETSNPEILCEEAGTDGIRRCLWTSYVADVCEEDPLKGCSIADGTSALCASPCLWNASTSKCDDPGSLPNGLTRKQYCRSITDNLQCGTALFCSWMPSSSLMGCRPFIPDHCTDSSVIRPGKERSDCISVGPCEWVDPPEANISAPTPAPTNPPASACPSLFTFSYPSATAVRYSTTTGNRTVELTCTTGYGQVGVQYCAGDGKLAGATQCVVRNCSDYIPGENMEVTGYTTVPPFGERQEGSQPVLTCNNSQNVTGGAPSCQGGSWVGETPSCSSPTHRGFEPLSSHTPRRVPHPAALQPQRQRSGRKEGWTVPDHDYNKLTTALQELRQRWAQGLRSLPDGHPHRHVMDVLEGGGNISNTTPAPTARVPTATAVLNGVCALDPTWIPDPLKAGDGLDWVTLCANELTKASCLSNPPGTVAGSATDREGKCKWMETETVTPDTILPSAPVAVGDMGTYDADVLPPVKFTMKDLGPTPDPTKPMPAKDETKPTPTNIRCEELPPGTSINPNPANFTTIWSRPFPNFPTRKRYREWQIDVGQVRYRSKAIRLVVAPTSDGRSQIDAVAIIGRQDVVKKNELRCKGEIWVSPVRDGTRSSAQIQTASVQPVPCSGRGRCGPRGCECFGNFYGEGCETCKFGWSGPGCDMPVPMGCSDIAFEDLSQFANEAELIARWKFENYRRFESSGLRWKHFGSKLTSPKYNLGDHTHIRLDVGTLMVDVPDSTNCGVVIGVARDRTGADYEVIYAAGCEFFSGLNIIGEERGDKIGFFSVQRRWPHSTASISVEVWWGDQPTGTYVFTILNFALQACSWPDI
eukprot:Sspe_Gene.8554::Locus_2897_Transcript_1_1_Confidence_1.000_Length_10047::g.8554::m.8554